MQTTLATNRWMAAQQSHLNTTWIYCANENKQRKQSCNCKRRKKLSLKKKYGQQKICKASHPFARTESQKVYNEHSSHTMWCFFLPFFENKKKWIFTFHIISSSSINSNKVNISRKRIRKEKEKVRAVSFDKSDDEKFIWNT